MPTDPKNPAPPTTPPPDPEPENYGMPANWTPVDAAPLNPNAPPPPPSALNSDGAFNSGPLPPNFGYQPALVKTGYPPSTGPIPLMPIQNGPQLGAAIQGTVTQVAKQVVNEAINEIVFPTTATGGVNEQTGNYTAQATDTEKLISFNITSASTLLLPATSPGSSFFILVENNGSALLTINPNGLDLDYAGNSIILGPKQGTTIYSDGTNYFTERGIGDGLAHGSSPTETDSSSVVMVDDFTSGNETSGSIGQLGWRSAGSGAIYQGAWPAPNFGSIVIDAGDSANTGLNLTPFDIASSFGGGVPPAGFPVTYNTGWDCSFIFRWPNFTHGGQVNLFTKVRLYLGFAALSTNNDIKRPAKFIGLRYDTDPGTALTLTQVTVSGSTTTYTGTITGGGSNAFTGSKFVVAGFTNAGNNITITVTSSTATTLVCTTSTQVNETHAGTATGPQLVDTTYHFECVQNAADGSNIQGSVFNTGISPDNNWHRFRIRSIAQGQILFSIDGGTETEISISTDTPPSGSSIEIFGNQPTTGFIEVIGNGITYYSAAAWGTPATLAGCTGGAAVLNGTYPVADNTAAVASTEVYLNSGVNSSASETSSTPTITWYNSFYPLILFGNDSESGPSQNTLAIDYFSFVYNPGLATDFNQSPNSTNPRFFTGQV